MEEHIATSEKLQKANGLIEVLKAQVEHGQSRNPTENNEPKQETNIDKGRNPIKSEPEQDFSKGSPIESDEDNDMRSQNLSERVILKSKNARTNSMKSNTNLGGKFSAQKTKF